jgi:hypothetical protein
MNRIPFSLRVPSKTIVKLDLDKVLHLEVVMKFLAVMTDLIVSGFHRSLHLSRKMPLFGPKSGPDERMQSN